VLVAPDAFKGTFSAAQVAAALGRGLEAAGCVPPDLCPVADGGEGTLSVLLTALGGETRGAEVRDPLGRTVRAGFGLIEDGATAVVEMAEASGLGRVAEGERDAEAASSSGTGELVCAAIDEGASVVLVAAGGSATTDGGAGAIEAIETGGGLRGAALVVLCDVRTPFERAAEVFAPQKGANPACVRRLTDRLDALASSLPRDPRGVLGGGAAGGLAGGLWAAFGAVLEPGAPFVLDTVGFGARMRAARDPGAAGRRALPRDRRRQRAGPLRRPHPRPAGDPRGLDAPGGRSGGGGAGGFSVSAWGPAAQGWPAAFGVPAPACPTCGARRRCAAPRDCG